MAVLAILLISSFFVLAAMAGLADAVVHFICWAADRLTAPRKTAEAARAPARGIAA